jgi:hypothetical protein
VFIPKGLQSEILQVFILKDLLPVRTQGGEGINKKEANRIGLVTDEYNISIMFVK